VFLGAIALVLIARRVRHEWWRRKGVVRISYPGGRSIEVVRGFTVLEASRLLGVPHASICGGKGRCSTCRVRVRAAPAALPEASSEELDVLRRIGNPPNVRLACQLRPQGPVEVTPLAAFRPAREALRRPIYAHGGERRIAILFADLRDFTHITETKLPYDVVFRLNRYCQAMGESIEMAGGRVDKFIGDGVMALFGLETAAPAACRQALTAACLMSIRLAALNRDLAPDLDAPLKMGLGIHFGPAIVGEMGNGGMRPLTAVGDTVNTASRLESLCKLYDCELVVSEDLVACAGVTYRAHIGERSRSVVIPSRS
jgi:adenylate cyclase